MIQLVTARTLGTAGAGAVASAFPRKRARKCRTCPEPPVVFGLGGVATEVLADHAARG